jgi:hypothetical protein
MDPTRTSRLRPLEQLEARDTPAFTPLAPFTAGVGLPTVLASADFNGDGFADVAVGNTRNAANVPSVSIALGQGDGRFVLASDLTDVNLGSPDTLVAADFNGDGRPDLAVGSYNVGAGTGSLLVYLGKGDGTFQPPQLVTNLPILALGHADYTGDAVPDLFAIIPDTAVVTGTVQVMANNGGQFTPIPTTTIPAPFDVNRVVTGDFDNDGFQDAIAFDANDRLLVQFYGDGKAGFTTPAPGFSPLPDQPFDAAVADVNGDGILDLILSTDAGIEVFNGLGTRDFDFANPVVVTTIPVGTTPFRLAVFDADRGGRPDLVAANPQETRFFLNNAGTLTLDPTGSFTLAAGSVFSDVATGDVNGDGNADYIVTRQTNNGTPSDGNVFLNRALVPTTTTVTATPSPGTAGQPIVLTANITFTGKPFPFGSLPSGTVTFDVDTVPVGTVPANNGVAKLSVMIPAGGHVIVARYTANAPFQSSNSGLLDYNVNPAVTVTYQYEVTGLPTLPGIGADRVASGNFFPDEASDIVLASGPGQPAVITLIDGTTRQAVTSAHPFGGAFFGGLQIAAGDIDGDGISDIAVAADEGGGPRVEIYLVKDGQLRLTNNFFALDDTFRGGLRLAFGDIDGDHHADLVVTGGPGAGPRVAVYNGTTLTEFHEPERLVNDFFAMDPDLRTGLYVAVGDLNNDGYGEIAVSPDTGGAPRVMIFNGESLFTTPTEIADFFAGNPDARGGARLAIRDISPQPGPELMVGDGPGSGSTVRVYSGPEVIVNPTPMPLVSSELLPGYLGGVFVA